jgi:hypothetical protein
MEIPLSGQNIAFVCEQVKFAQILKPYCQPALKGVFEERQKIGNKYLSLRSMHLCRVCA